MRADRSVVVGLALAIAACDHGGSRAPCPSGAWRDESREHAIEARLASVAEGRVLLDAQRDRVARVCFTSASSASVVTHDRVVILAQGLEEGEAAARLGHLLVHLRDGLPIDAVSPGLAAESCDAAVGRALALEAHAYVVEIALQDELGVHPQTLAFEFGDAVRAASGDSREGIVLAYLRDHPTGGQGIDGLAEAYRARCR